MNNQQQNRTVQSTDDLINIQQLFQLCVAKWRWFAISGFSALLLAVIYILFAVPKYERGITLMIKEDSSSSSLLGGGIMNSLSAFGLGGQGSALANNEVIAFQSPALTMEVVKRLDLDVRYSARPKLRKEVLYGKNQPVEVSFLDLDIYTPAKFDLKLLPNQQVEIDNLKWGKKQKSNEPITGVINSILITPMGRVQIATNPNYVKGEEPISEIKVDKGTLYDVTDAYCKSLNIDLTDDIMASVINIDFKQPSIELAEDFLEMLIDVYNEKWVEEKNVLAKTTSKFIDERLEVIVKELGEVDSEIATFQSENRLIDLEESAKLYMEKAEKADESLMWMNIQLEMAKYIVDYLKNPTYANSLLPANTGIENKGIEDQIVKYNEAQIERNNIVANSSESNPLVIELNNTLASMRSVIITSIENHKVTIKTNIASLEKRERESVALITDAPEQAKYLLTTGRQQKVKEALYLYLLERREENELSQAFTAYNTRIITPPYGKMTPASPQKKIVLIVALLMGLLLPVIALVLMKIFDTTISSRKDLQGLSIPFLGEIPLVKGKIMRSIGGSTNNGKRPVVVENGKQDYVNESFRILRTNIEFLSSSALNRSHVFLFTSANPDSGKTFITMNLALSFALKGVKSLVIDGDMRMGAQSRYVDSPRTGSVNYLSGQNEDLSALIVKSKVHDLVDVLPVGALPPNPAELLVNGRFGQMIDELRGKYNYIFIDCPPIDVVTDAAIIEKYADRTVFVIRSKRFERSMLSELEVMFQEKRFKNMSIVFNGAENTANRNYGQYYKSK